MRLSCAGPHEPGALHEFLRRTARIRGVPRARRGPRVTDADAYFHFTSRAALIRRRAGARYMRPGTRKSHRPGWPRLEVFGVRSEGFTSLQVRLSRLHTGMFDAPGATCDPSDLAYDASVVTFVTSGATFVTSDGSGQTPFRTAGTTGCEIRSFKARMMRLRTRFTTGQTRLGLMQARMIEPRGRAVSMSTRSDLTAVGSDHTSTVADQSASEC